MHSKLFTLVKSLATGAYIAPWRDVVRARIMIIGFLGNLGYGALSFALNYSMAGYDLFHSLTYQMLRMALMGYVMVPFTFWFLSRFRSPFYLFVLQLFGLNLYLIDPGSGILNAMGIALSFSPYLALNAYRFSKNQSAENRGNETALNSYVITIAYSIGLFIGGLCLQHDWYYQVVIGGSLTVMIGAYFLYFPLTAKNNAQKIWSLIGYKRPSTRISFFYGIFNPMVDGCMPVWMRMLGISPLGAGINMSLRPMFGLFLTPIVGWLIQKKGFRAGQLGGIGMVIGWALVAGAAQYPWMLALGLGVLAMGTNLLNPMEVGRWFKRRSSAAIISREIVVASGRVTSYAIGISTAFLLPAAFPLLGLTVGGLFIAGTRFKRRGLGGKR